MVTFRVAWLFASLLCLALWATPVLRRLMQVTQNAYRGPPLLQISAGSQTLTGRNLGPPSRGRWANVGAQVAKSLSLAHEATKSGSPLLWSTTQIETERGDVWITLRYVIPTLPLSTSVYESMESSRSTSPPDHRCSSSKPAYPISSTATATWRSWPCPGPSATLA